MPGAGCQVGPARTSGQSASPVTDSLYLSAMRAVRSSRTSSSRRWWSASGRGPPRDRPPSRTASCVGRSATGGFHFLCPSLSNFGRARTTSPRSISARSSILGPWYGGSGGRRIGDGHRQRQQALGRRLLPSFPGGGAATSVLARTASGDFQPSASLAACVAAAIRSGAGVIFTDVVGSAAWQPARPWPAPGQQRGRCRRRGRRRWPVRLSGCTGQRAGTRRLSSARPCTSP